MVAKIPQYYTRNKNNKKITIEESIERLYKQMNPL